MEPTTVPVREVVAEAVADSAAMLRGDADELQGTLLTPLHFSTGLATQPSALERQTFGLAAHLIVPPGTWAVVHLPGGERRTYLPGSYMLWGMRPGAILAQWVDARRQQVPIGPIEGWSADKWRVRLWLIADVEVIDPVVIAAHREPLSTFVAAVRTALLKYVEQHSHALLTGTSDGEGGFEAPAHFVRDQLVSDPALDGLRLLNVRVVERQGDERQIEASTAATVAAAQIDEELRVAEARNRARLHELEAQATIGEREHTLRLAAASAKAREQLVNTQAEVQHATLAARAEIVLAQIKAQVAEIEHEEQCWQAEQSRLHAEWERVQQQQLEVHQTNQQARLLETQHSLIRSESEVALRAAQHQHSHELALAGIQQRIAEQRTAQAQVISDRRAHHEQTLLELHLRHEQLVAEQMQRLEQWRGERAELTVQQQRQHDRQIAVIAGTAQIAAAAARPVVVDPPNDDDDDVADSGLKTLQALAG